MSLRPHPDVMTPDPGEEVLLHEPNPPWRHPDIEYLEFIGDIPTLTKFRYRASYLKFTHYCYRCEAITVWIRPAITTLREELCERCGHGNCGLRGDGNDYSQDSY